MNYERLLVYEFRYSEFGPDVFGEKKKIKPSKNSNFQKIQIFKKIKLQKIQIFRKIQMFCKLFFKFSKRSYFQENLNVHKTIITKFKLSEESKLSLWNIESLKKSLNKPFPSCSI